MALPHLLFQALCQQSSCCIVKLCVMFTAKLVYLIAPLKLLASSVPACRVQDMLH